MFAVEPRTTNWHGSVTISVGRSGSTMRFAQQVDAGLDDRVHRLVDRGQVERLPRGQVDVVVADHPDVVGHADAERAGAVQDAEGEQVGHRVDRGRRLLLRQQLLCGRVAVGVRDADGDDVARLDLHARFVERGTEAELAVAGGVPGVLQPDQADLGVARRGEVAAGVVRALPVVADHLVAVQAVDPAVQQDGRRTGLDGHRVQRRVVRRRGQQEPVDQPLLQHLADRLLRVVLDVPQDHVQADRAEHAADLVQQFGVERAGHAGHEDADRVGAPGLHRAGQRVRRVVGFLEDLKHPGPGLGVDPWVVGQHPRHGRLGHPRQTRQVPAGRWSTHHCLPSWPDPNPTEECGPSPLTGARSMCIRIHCIRIHPPWMGDSGADNPLQPQPPPVPGGAGRHRGRQCAGRLRWQRQRRGRWRQGPHLPQLAAGQGHAAGAGDPGPREGLGRERHGAARGHPGVRHQDAHAARRWGTAGRDADQRRLRPRLLRAGRAAGPAPVHREGRARRLAVRQGGVRVPEAAGRLAHRLGRGLRTTAGLLQRRHVQGGRRSAAADDVERGGLALGRLRRPGEEADHPGQAVRRADLPGHRVRADVHRQPRQRDRDLLHRRHEVHAVRRQGDRGPAVGPPT